MTENTETGTVAWAHWDATESQWSRTHVVVGSAHGTVCGVMVPESMNQTTVGPNGMCRRCVAGTARAVAAAERAERREEREAAAATTATATAESATAETCGSCGERWEEDAFGGCFHCGEEVG